MTTGKSLTAPIDWLAFSSSLIILLTGAWAATRKVAGVRGVPVERPQLGYRKTNQTGSHIHLRTDEPSGQTTIIPAHRPVKVGTLNGILNHVARHKQVTREDIPRGL